MIWMILLALCNGLLIGFCRALNGRLSQDKGPFTASFYNHAIGALLLTFIVIIFSVASIIPLTLSNVWLEVSSSGWQEAPLLTYLGGVIGALYVAINSHVLTRIGALKTALFVISGQMITGVIFDISEQSMTASIAQVLGVGLIIIGIYHSQHRS
ncbi:DMT family transporter [Photobacterium frigidiphilum]|uniref:DMT family transporter n=1 Tax=Photobacterium frigidiphilum TaxID=264736 RepID=UPI003D14BF84